MATEDIHIRVPRHFTPKSAADTSTTPPLEWLHRTWTVTHSTLKRWRTAQNLTITYGTHPPTSASHPRVTDAVRYQSKGQRKVSTIKGIDTAADDTTVWDWRGSGLLKPISCRWELLGWGERTQADGTVERWAVTWFAKTLFTEEGIDVYCDRREGMSEGTAAAIRGALEGLGREELASLAKERLEAVAIDLSMKPEA
ncbi:uncharacterized protein DNG_06063 [Cephalotrichum gorgonifer]|uniref:Uncharacterized protein n=1 Tax=Cephalotrichum gorgonifer TaxID=2041049 RepID=A0AAE8MZ97_9PEZI|nr:uncharacterized protein DNG_06063 [Cephalotrichum gorgonifer]